MRRTSIMRTTLYIQNLSFGGCENFIIQKLSNIKNIDNVTINRTYDTVNFEYKTKEDIEIVKKKLSKLGFPPFGEKNNLRRKAKSYMGCAVGKLDYEN